MATKKNAPALEVPENEDAELEQESEKLAQMAEDSKPDPQMLAMMAEMERLKKENEALKKNSVYSPSSEGGASDRERVAKACEEAAKKDQDPWKIKISVLAPRIGKGEDSYWLCVNGKSIQVPANDRYYELALPFAQCMVDEIAARTRAADYADKIEVYDPVLNPKPADKEE